MDQLYKDLVKECKFTAPGAQLSFSIRNRLEKYKRAVRKTIVSRLKDDCTPLFLAAKRGNVEIVEYLITTCDADVEERGVYEIPEDRSVHYVTPLWCAAVSGKLRVVKCLIRHGADVNAVSDSGSTPVRSVCYMTHLGKYLFLVHLRYSRHITGSGIWVKLRGFQCLNQRFAIDLLLISVEINSLICRRDEWTNWEKFQINSSFALCCENSLIQHSFKRAMGSKSTQIIALAQNVLPVRRWWDSNVHDSTI